MLLGKTGSGKSSLANTIFEPTGQFETRQSPKSITKDCQSYKKEIDGKIIQLIDTPGFYDTAKRSLESNYKIYCLKMCAPGPHAFLLVFKVERYTTQEEDVVKKMIKCFSEDAFNYTTVVFTHGDQLEKGTKILTETLTDWIRESEALRTLVQKCGGRVHVFDNKHWKNNQDQVRELLKSIEQTVEKNGGGYYTKGFWQRIKNFHIKGIPSHVLLGLILGGVVFGGVGVYVAAVANMSMSGVVAVGAASGLVGAPVGAGAVMALDPEASEAVRGAASDAVRSYMKGLCIEAEKHKTS